MHHQVTQVPKEEDVKPSAGVGRKPVQSPGLHQRWSECCCG